MCGIAGIAVTAGDPPDLEDVARMCAVMTHRGPDDEGRLLDSGVALGMRRLSVIDLAGGAQPIYNEDRSVAVVCNGEIYNYRELRAELETQGHRFATASDTEVIVHLWEEHGTRFPQRLNGMFAIALLDRRQRRLVLVRDHIGIKPLYYAATANAFVFGSEPKVVLASGRPSRGLDVDALGQFLAWEYVPGAATLFREIRRLEPASLLELELDTGRRRIERFWDVTAVADRPVADTAATLDDWADEVDATVHRCVRRQLVADVPLGAFLSGGVDSSLVVAAMGHATAFSIGFEDPSYDELGWAGQVARHLGVRHVTEVVSPQIEPLFDRLMHFMDDPIGDFSIFPTYLVSRLARREVTVALSGDGGDELFGGYDTYRAQRFDRWWRRLPRSVRQGLIAPLAARVRPTAAKKGAVNTLQRFLEGSALDPALGAARWRLFLDDVRRSKLFTPDALARIDTSAGRHIEALRGEARGLAPPDQPLYVDLRSYLVDNCLTKVDRMSMACSLEARVPLLDREMVELAFRIPPRFKFAGGGSKPLLKRVAARHVPAGCVYRAKQGFSIPIKNWLRDELRPLVDRYLSRARLEAAGLVRFDAVERLKQEHLAGVANHSHLLWSLIVFEDWRSRWGADA